MIVGVIPILFMVIFFGMIFMISKDAKKLKDIEQGCSNKILLNEKTLDSKGTTIFVFIFCGIFIGLSIVPLTQLYVSATSGDIFTSLFMLVFCLITFAAPIYIIISQIKYSKRIKEGNYYFVKDSVIDKMRRRHNDSTSYYLRFASIPANVKCTSRDYHESQNGDEFYILINGTKLQAYSTKYYEVEDPSKIESFRG